MLLLDKPHGLSSNVALQKARHLLHAEKAGHTGTLDPEATGLLPLCFGEATKFSGYLLDAPKGYEALLQLGETSSTGDAEGDRVPGPGPVPAERSVVEGVLTGLVGPLDQILPMHSALKHAGRPLYDYARAGIEVPRAARRIEVLSLRLLEFAGSRLRVQVDCSKGTYVRVLAEEIGLRLGCGAWLAGLRRNRTGGFGLQQAVSLERLAELDDASRIGTLLAPECLVADLPLVVLDEQQADWLLHGRAAPFDSVSSGILPGQTVRVHIGDGVFVGLAAPDAEGRLQAVRLLSEHAK